MNPGACILDAFGPSSNQCMYDIICGNQGHSLEFNISGAELIQGISHKYCQIVHRQDGYGYAF